MRATTRHLALTKGHLLEVYRIHRFEVGKLTSKDRGRRKAHLKLDGGHPRKRCPKKGNEEISKVDARTFHVHNRQRRRKQVEGNGNLEKCSGAPFWRSHQVLGALRRRRLLGLDGSPAHTENQVRFLEGSNDLNREDHRPVLLQQVDICFPVVGCRKKTLFGWCQAAALLRE